jgi:hypothetical protein
MYSAARIGRAIRWLLTGTPAQRRRVRHELARMAAALFGDFPISDDHKSWRDDLEFRADYRRLSPGNPYSEDRKWTLREFARMTNSLPGDIAECGCYEGTSAYFMAQVSSHGQIHLFDSFEGVSEPDGRDRPDREDVIGWNKGDLGAVERKLQANLAGFVGIQSYRGWIPTRFDAVAGQQFRLVHIDVDLYQPTWDSLEFFFPRLVEGGYLVMDDYGFNTCPGARKAADDFAARHQLQILHLPTGQGVIVKTARIGARA